MYTPVSQSLTYEQWLAANSLSVELLSSAEVARLRAVYNDLARTQSYYAPIHTHPLPGPPAGCIRDWFRGDLERLGEDLGGYQPNHFWQHPAFYWSAAIPPSADLRDHIHMSDDGCPNDPVTHDH